MAHLEHPKGAFFLERGRKRMKEWGEVTFMKEWMKALPVGVILAPTFPRYSRLNEKFRDNIFPNSKYIFLFIELSESYLRKHL